MNRSGLWHFAALILIGLVCVAVGGWLRAIYTPEWLLTQPASGLRPWAVEADCYSQLARVQRILHGDGLIQNHFKVENWPEGMVPSTTAPFDYAILLLYAPLALFTKYPLDWAGAFVSPALWVALLVFWMIFRFREFNWTGSALFLIGSTLLPAFIWATACGRPRHQSLIIALMAVGLTAEYERWHLELSPKRAWNIFAGVIWGLACWTSLFEPALVVVLLILFNLIMRRRESPAFLISFGTVMLIALVVEGVHVFVPPPEYREAFERWWGTIDETRGLDFTNFMVRMTFITFVLPFMAWKVLRREGDRRTDLFLVLLTTLLTLFTIFQSRWYYYASLGGLFLIVRYCQVEPLRWTRWVVYALFLISAIDADDKLIEAHANEAPYQPSLQLVQISGSIDQPGGILAPWWLSPGLLYFSGQPIVSGSSHCGISGIVASAKFYTATSWLDAEKVLKERKVRWVVVFDDPDYVYPMTNAARGILGQPFYSDEAKGDVDSTMGQVLITDHNVPSQLVLRAVTEKLKLYEYMP